MVAVEGFEPGLSPRLDEGALVSYTHDDVICRVKPKKFVGESSGCGRW
jgi:hypothetical protein